MPTPTDAGFTAEERAAMKARARELKDEARTSATRADGERAILAALAAMPESDRTLGERVHALVTATAPDLVPRLWYGMPAYAKDGKVLCFFQSAQKFSARYATLGFADVAALDDGAMWPVAYALTAMTDAEAAAVRALVQKAVG